jgi:GNAT superfamily N-acetyltransferase
MAATTGQRTNVMTTNRKSAREPFTTKELSTRTWPDFERLFSQGGGWDFCACMLTQRGCHLSEREFPTRAERKTRNHEEKQQLVDQGRAHGILVYIDAEPIGWCQYGPVEELPISGLAGPDRRNILRAADPTSQWRIPCFVTHKKHRGRGVASAALAAALDSIKRQGGGWVEATPIAMAHQYLDERARELRRTYGPQSLEVKRYLEKRPWPETQVQGVGSVKAMRGTFGNVSTPGTVSMFERQGFTAVELIADTHVLMRKHL